MLYKILAGLFICALIIASNRVALSEERTSSERADVVRNEIKSMRSEGFDEAEIARQAERMINGRSLGFKENASWATAIFRNGIFVCSGTFISPVNINLLEHRRFEPNQRNPLWVVTAAHCFGKGTGVLDNISEYEFGSGSKFLNEQLINRLAPLKIVRHEKYNSKTFANDVALVRLQVGGDGKLIARASVAVVTEKHMERVAKKYARLTAYGWGATRFNKVKKLSKTLLRIDLPVVSPSDCQKAHSNSKNSTVRQADIKNTICAGFSTGGSGICNGDSGSGAVYSPTSAENLIINEPMLFGITSWSLLCGLEDGFDVFTDLRAYIPWIWETVLRVEKEVTSNNQ